MINDWKKFFAEHGFEKFARRDFVRVGSPISALAGEIPGRVGERRVRVHLALEIQNPFAAERDYHVMHLFGDVTPEAILVHHDHTPHWLEPEQRDSVFAVLEGCMEPWFSYWDARQWIRYLEDPLDLVSTVPSNGPQGVKHILGQPALTRRHPPATDDRLSLLYYHLGEREKALHYAKRYLESVSGSITSTGAYERTLRLIKALQGGGS